MSDALIGDDAPTTRVLDCWDTGHQFAAWCTYCHVWHFHAREEGSRAPHCLYRRDELPDGWYALRLVGKWTDQVEAEHADEAQRGRRLYDRWVREGGPRGAVTFAQVWSEHEAKRVGPVAKSPAPASGRRRS